MNETLPHCYICGSLEVSRERRIDGFSICESGHKYPSRKAVYDMDEVKRIANAYFHIAEAAFGGHKTTDDKQEHKGFEVPGHITENELIRLYKNAADEYWKEVQYLTDRNIQLHKQVQELHDEIAQLSMRCSMLDAATRSKT